jgi:hypothetical protein
MAEELQPEAWGKIVALRGAACVLVNCTWPERVVERSRRTGENTARFGSK